MPCRCFETKLLKPLPPLYTSKIVVRRSPQWLAYSLRVSTKQTGITHVAATVDVQSHEFLPHWVVSTTVDVQRRQTVR